MTRHPLLLAVIGGACIFAVGIALTYKYAPALGEAGTLVAQVVGIASVLIPTAWYLNRPSSH